MALRVVHTKTVTIPDGNDTNLVRPSDWNADHTIEGAGGAAVLEVGTTVGTVAAGNDGRWATEAGLRAAADALLAPKASPALTGVPTAPTAAPGVATTQLATTEFVDAVEAAILLDIGQESTDRQAADDGLQDNINDEEAARIAADILLAPLTAIKLPRSHLAGLTLSNDITDAVNDILVAVGECRDSTNAADLVLASPLIKKLDAAWAVGNNQGGRMSAAAIADTSYHVFVIRRPDTGVVDIGIDVSATAPTLPTNYTQFRRIGSIIRVSGVIKAFSQRGDIFLWAAVL